MYLFIKDIVLMAASLKECCAVHNIDLSPGG